MTISYDELKLKLKPEQRIAAKAIVDNAFATKDEKKTLDEIAEEIGIDRKTIYNWRQNPDFTKYKAALTENEADRGYSFVIGRLMWLIENGASNNKVPPIRAIELYLKYTGKLEDKRTVTINDENHKPTMTRAQVSDGLENLEKFVN